MKTSLVDMIEKRKAKDPSFAPGLAIIQVGNRGDSALYIKKKLAMAKVCGVIKLLTRSLFIFKKFFSSNQ